MGTTAGFSIEADGTRRALVRDGNGFIDVFDAPGADRGNNLGTRAYAMNSSGDVVGFYNGVNKPRTGFIRDRRGNFTILRTPGPPLRDPGRVLFASSINDAGVVSGIFTDEVGLNHGFIRNRGGRISIFDVPRMVSTTTGSGCCQQGYGSLNQAGDLVGVATDVTGDCMGLRAGVTGTSS